MFHNVCSLHHEVSCVCFAAALLLDVYSMNDVIEREQRDDYYVEVVIQLAWLTDALTEW